MSPLQKQIHDYLIAAQDRGEQPTPEAVDDALGFRHGITAHAIWKMRQAGVVLPPDLLPSDSGLRIPDDASLRRIGAQGRAVVLNRDGSHALAKHRIAKGAA